MSHLEKALLDPTSVYRMPSEVLTDSALSREEKIKVLRRWEYDARGLQTAEGENMGSAEDTGSLLSRVLKALHTLE